MCVYVLFLLFTAACTHGVRFDGQSFGRKRGNRAPGPVLAPNILLARREYSTGAVVLRTTPRRIPCTVAPPPHTHARTHAYVCAPHGEPACPAPPPPPPPHVHRGKHQHQASLIAEDHALHVSTAASA